MPPPFTAEGWGLAGQYDSPEQKRCADALHSSTVAHRNQSSIDSELALLGAIEGFVDCFRENGSSPEGMLVALKSVMDDASRVPLDGNQPWEQESIVDRRMNAVVSHAIGHFYQSGKPRPSLDRRAAPRQDSV